MARLASRLRGWWRGAYMAGGLGHLLQPGYATMLHRDREIMYRYYAIYRGIYEPGWALAVINGVPYIAPSYAELSRMVLRVFEEGSIPTSFLTDVPSMRF